MRLLDTNILSEMMRPRPDPGVIMALREWRSDEVFASAVTRYELRYGASLRDDGEPSGRDWKPTFCGW